jgi:serralysin
VALLLQRRDVEPEVIARILTALDRAAAFYQDIAGREPAPNRLFEGRITIAEVEEIGAAAHAYLGETGIEIAPDYFDVLYRSVRDTGLFDQPLFYELGRNYWFLGRTLDVSPGSVCTGYAVFMRFEAMDASRVEGAPYNGWPFDRFRAAVSSLLDVFVERSALSWVDLLATSPMPVHTFQEAGLLDLSLSTADLLASLFEKLCAEHGGMAFFRRFLHAADGLPSVSSAEGICANLLASASSAAGKDLGGQFREWRWPAL